MCCCSGTNKPKETSQMVKDVVCGMTIDPKTAAGQSEYQGKTYYFCAPGCKRKFDANPQQFVK
jgi:YHS domain-containing protein